MKRAHNEIQTEGITDNANATTSSSTEEVKAPEAKRQRITSKSPSEESVGITEFIFKQGKAIKGILKQRYEDFIVNEVDMAGNVVYLTSTSIPEEAKTVGSESMSAEEKAKLIEQGCEKLKTAGISEAFIAQIREFITKEDASAAAVKEIEAVQCLYFEPEENKEKRQEIHNIVKTYFPMLVSDSAEREGGKRCIRIRYNSTQLTNAVKNKFNKQKKGKQRGQSRDLFDPRTQQWPTGRGEFLEFVMYKENRDTVNAVNTLSKYVKLKQNLFNYAGTKDKRGVTVQKVTAKKVPAEKLISINSNPKLGITIGNFRYVEKQLLLGNLQGNRFTVVLREIDPSTEASQVQESVDSLSTKGFINYFGMQRFGVNAQFPTHKIGAMVLKGDWKEAVTSLLQTRFNEGSFASKKLEEVVTKFFEDKDGRTAHQNCPREMMLEKMLLQGYASVGSNDHFGAFNNMPRTLRTLFVHGYQSYIWNSLVSERIRKYGLQVVEGDLVWKNKSAALANQEVTDEVSEIETTTMEDSSSAAQESTTTTSEKVNSEVKYITKEDLANYTIYDVVMPLPGSDILYPTHDIGSKAYEELMLKDGVDIKHLQHQAKGFMTKGAYRNVVSLPKDVSWKLENYDDFKVKLVATDLDKLKGITLENPASQTGKFKALILQFTLPVSSYATMLIREVTKTSSVESS